MNNRKDVEIFLAIAAPFCVVGVPVLFGMIGFAAWRDSKAGLEVDFLGPRAIVIIPLLLFSFFFSLFYCRTHLRLFRRRPKEKPDL